MIAPAKLNLAWLSRHPPTDAQRRCLRAYRIHEIHPPDRFYSAADAWVLVQNRCGIPDLIFCIMPPTMLKDFLRLVAGRTPVIRAVWDYSCEPPRWTGEWEQIKAVQIVTEVWTPNEGGQHGRD